ncbi:MAG: hypothetical protein ACREPM_14945 [Gemmatimonadaceae bacterium]
MRTDPQLLVIALTMGTFLPATVAGRDVAMKKGPARAKAPKSTPERIRENMHASLT